MNLAGAVVGFIAGCVLVGCSGAQVARVAVKQTVKGVVKAEAAAAANAKATMRAGAEICIEESRDMRAAAPRFREAGWRMDALGPQVFEMSKDGVGGYLDAERASCRFEADRVSLDEAKRLIDGLVAERFSSIAQKGPMEGPAGPCDGWVLFPGQGTVAIGYDGLGQDPVCPDPAGASILVRGGA